MLPKSVKVGGHRYKVLFPYGFKDRSDVRGLADHQLYEIRISDNDEAGNMRPASAIQETFLHEILHCADNLCGHHVFNDKEGAIEGLSEALFQILRDNDLSSLWRDDMPCGKKKKKKKGKKKK
jgi:hypothetical protein